MNKKAIIEEIIKKVTSTPIDIEVDEGKWETFHLSEKALRIFSDEELISLYGHLVEK